MATPTIHAAPRRCANPKCRRVLTESERTFHCDDCHRTDPELIRLAQAYWARLAQRGRISEEGTFGGFATTDAAGRGR